MRMKKILLASALGFALWGGSASAQTVPGCQTSPGCVVIQPFLASGKATLTAGVTSSNVALGSVGGNLNVYVANASATIDAWVTVGVDNTVVATAAAPSILVPAGSGTTFPIKNGTYIAAITGSSTAALTVYTGTGSPTIVLGAGGGGGGPATVADGADVTQGAKADTAYAGSGAATVVAILKGLYNLLAQPLAVTGTFWQATQPVSGTVTTSVAPLTYATPDTLSVGTTSTALATAAQYKTLQICTLPASTTNVWLNLRGAAAVASAGVPVFAGGGCTNLGTQALPMPTAAINAITDSVSAQTVTLAGG
jgi:hypothetical protein